MNLHWKQVDNSENHILYLGNKILCKLNYQEINDKITVSSGDVIPCIWKHIYINFDGINLLKRHYDCISFRHLKYKDFNIDSAKKMALDKISKHLQNLLNEINREHSV